MEPIILASESKRRHDFFRLLDLPFTSFPSNVDESFDPRMEASSVVKELAERKVKKILETLDTEKFSWVCGADTLITLDGKYYGKPEDRADAANMLRCFQGRKHQVITGITLYNGKKKTFDSRSVISEVSFASLSDKEIDWYLDSGEWQGVAGSYQIQGLASCLINAINGSFSSIMGLPLREFYVMLRDNGYPFGV